MNINELENINKQLDLDNNQVSDCLYWSCDQVCKFFEEELALPEYKQTLRSNRIDGKRLIYLDASHLPKIGIHDWKHILLITRKVRDLLKIEPPYWNRSIQDMPRNQLDLYLEAKSFSGINSAKLNYKEFKESTEDSKWQPPLANQGFIMPSC